MTIYIQNMHLVYRVQKAYVIFHITVQTKNVSKNQQPSFRSDPTTLFLVTIL